MVYGNPPINAICDLCDSEVETWVWYKGFLLCNPCFDVECETCKFKAGLHAEDCEEIQPASKTDKTCSCNAKDLFTFGCRCGGK